MPMASTEVNSVERATFLEHCFCPEGYEGLSCERCAKGYRRVNNTLVNGICEKCPCNNHVDSCDAFTARCGPCLHNTIGPNCERCKPGFFGDPTLGNEDDCKPCACPLTIPSNHFADGCRSISATGENSYDNIDENNCIYNIINIHICMNNIVFYHPEYECINCAVGYTGLHCERCAEGYFGNPTVIGGKCLPCDCGPNVDKSRPGWCDHRTGFCNYCLGNTDGWNCSRCKKLYYGNPTLPDCRGEDSNVIFILQVQ